MAARGCSKTVAETALPKAHERSNSSSNLGRQIQTEVDVFSSSSRNSLSTNLVPLGGHHAREATKRTRHQCRLYKNTAATKYKRLNSPEEHVISRQFYPTLC